MPDNAAGHIGETKKEDAQNAKPATVEVSADVEDVPDPDEDDLDDLDGTCHASPIREESLLLTEP